MSGCGCLQESYFCGRCGGEDLKVSTAGEVTVTCKCGRVGRGASVAEALKDVSEKEGKR